MTSTDRADPQEEQNFPPCDCAPQDPQRGWDCSSSVISEVRSTSRSLSRTWYRRASACSCASSSDATGEHRTHWSTCSFQHTAPHTQPPQPRHWWKCGEISVTALFRALSFASEFVDRSSNRSAAEVTP